jgi:GT2 family glycosyltransferase
MGVDLHRDEHPMLSVVMVTHGAWELAEQAIGGLAQHTTVPFELIVIDNASPDRTRMHVSQITGARVILNDENRGFGPAANQGAEVAVGEYLLLLNSDAFVHSGWFEPLRESLARPTVGAVVPCYLGRDGLLQEAGVLLARDGTVRLYGEGDDPSRGCYRFRRTIDYGSAVCMLMRCATFVSLGGFDRLYGRAYYEDADLCLRLTERGMSVVYEPRSTVTHIRYGSGGLEEAERLSEHNRKLFVARWQARLLGRPSSFVRASDQATILARDVLAWPRFLVCAERSDRLAQNAVNRLLGEFGAARVTWAGSNPAAGEQAPIDGVELLDEPDPSWLAERLFHYDVVLRGASASPRLLDAVRRTQPHAPHIDVAAPDLGAALAAAGIAPAALLTV